MFKIKKGNPYQLGHWTTSLESNIQETKRKKYFIILLLLESTI